MYRTAIVNSKSFGVHSDALRELERLGEVVRLDLPRDIGGRELAERLRGVHFVIASVTPRYGREFFEHNGDVVLVARHGIGYDNVDVEAATEHGVVVSRVPGHVEREAVAELAIALMLDAARRVSHSFIAVREGRWRDRGRFIGFELRGKKVGVIGLGNIGGRVAEILSKGFGAEVLAYDPYVSEERARSVGARLVGLDTLLRESDAITLHAALTPENYHMLGREEFGKMKDGVVIVNAARGELIDMEALLQALEEGKVGYVAFDVVEGEPIDADHPLLKYENVVITPHIGAYTRESLSGMDEAMVEAIKSVIRGEPPEGIINREVYERGVRRLPGDG